MNLGYGGNGNFLHFPILSYLGSETLVGLTKKKACDYIQEDHNKLRLPKKFKLHRKII